MRQSRGRGVLPSHLLPETAFRAFQLKIFHNFPHWSKGQEQSTKPSRAELALREEGAIPLLLDLVDHGDAQFSSRSEEASHKQMSNETTEPQRWTKQKQAINAKPTGL